MYNKRLLKERKVIIQRNNAMGMTYHLTQAPIIEDGRLRIDPTKTRVCWGAKFITVDCPLDEMVARWYEWTIKNKYIQDAFDNLSATEREFLMTGITEEQWNEMFKEPNERISEK